MPLNEDQKTKQLQTEANETKHNKKTEKGADTLKVESDALPDKVTKHKPIVEPRGVLIPFKLSK